MTPAETKARIETGLKCRDDLREHWSAVMVPVSIMVVDDNAFCDLLSDQIRAVLKRKCEIKCVTTGNEAIEILKAVKVDVLFVDLRMPKATGSGMDVLAAAKEISAATVVLIVTGAMPDAPEIAEAVAQGHTLIIRKAELFDDLCLIFAGDGCPFNPDRCAPRL